jgi:hypothetical protein
MAQELRGPDARPTGQLEHVAGGREPVEGSFELVPAREVERVLEVLGCARPVVIDLLGQQPSDA